MKTIVKILAAGVGVFALIVIGAALYFRFFFDPNDVREQIAAKVSEQTGRSFAIEGDLGVRYFPWLGIDIGRTRLGEDPAFGKDDFVVFESASASVKLLPLFSKRLEVGRLTVDGLVVNLIRNKDGVDNWQSLVDHGADADAPAPASDGSTSFTTDRIGGLSISSARITLDDRQANNKVVVSDLNATTGEVALGQKPVRIDSSFKLSASNPALEAVIEFGGEVDADDAGVNINEPRFVVNGSNQEVIEDLPFANFSLTVNAPKMRLAGANIDISAPTITLDADGGTGELTTIELSFESGDVRSGATTIDVAAPKIAMKGTGDGTTVNAFDGTINAQSMRVTDTDIVTMTAPQFDTLVTMPDMPANMRVQINAKTLSTSLGKQTLQVDDYQFESLGVVARGSLSGTSIVDAPQFRGPIQIDAFAPGELLKKLDTVVDVAAPYALTMFKGTGELRATDNSAVLANMTATLDKSKLTGSAGISNFETSAQTFDLTIDTINADDYLPPVSAADAEQGASSTDAIDIPAETIRELNMNGTVKIGQMTLSGLQSSNVVVGLNAAGGKVRVFPSTAQLYGGSYSGDIRVDASGDVPVVSMNEKLTGVDFGPLGAALIADNPMTGKLTGNLTMTARGTNTAQLKSTLNGETGFSFADGVLSGVDVLEIVEGIVALANKSAPVIGKGAKTTPFTKLGGMAKVTDGVLVTENLEIEMPLINVSGQGMVDLNTTKIDFKVTTRVVDVPGRELKPELRKAIGYKIPVYIGGTYDAPAWVSKEKSALDLTAQLAKTRLVDKLGLGKKDEDGVTSKEDADAAAKDEKERLKDEVDEKAKKLLRGLLGG